MKGLFKIEKTKLKQHISVGKNSDPGLIVLFAFSFTYDITNFSIHFHYGVKHKNVMFH